ncbi:hypothetical protein ACERNI_16960 [Camelimonas sp. ID_303_24]
MQDTVIFAMIKPQRLAAGTPHRQAQRRPLSRLSRQIMLQAPGPAHPDANPLTPAPDSTGIHIETLRPLPAPWGNRRDQAAPRHTLQLQDTCS